MKDTNSSSSSSSYSSNGSSSSRIMQSSSSGNVKEYKSIMNSYATMVSSINTLEYLRSLDSGERLEPRDKITNTAARVGLSVPSFADEDKVKEDYFYKFNPNLRIYT